MDRVRRALRAREIGGRRTGVQVDDVLLLGEVGDGEPDARTGEIDEYVHLLDFDPLFADVGADVGLVLVIGRDQIDFSAFGQKTRILDRHLSGNSRARASNVSVQTRLIAETSDPHDLVELALSECASNEHETGSERQGCN